MLIVRSPLRISLGGGGTDLPSYYREHEGFLISAAINKYVYVTLNKPFKNEFILKYSQLETTDDIENIKHPIIRESLKYVGWKNHCLELSSISDIPAGTGLGSSSSFTAALLKALHIWQKDVVHPELLAQEACHIEIDILKNPIGKQDQYISAYGGITCFKFLKNDKVEVQPLKTNPEVVHELEENLLLFFTGYERSASAILKEQDDKTKYKENDVINNLHFIKELGLKNKEALETGNLHYFAELMNTHWEFKKQRSKNMSNDKINSWYELGLKSGALGGKVVGAGGGGFLMFYANDKTKLRSAMQTAGLQEVRFNFDFLGSSVVVNV